MAMKVCHVKNVCCFCCSRMQRADRMSKETEYRQYKVGAVRYLFDTQGITFIGSLVILISGCFV